MSEMVPVGQTVTHKPQPVQRFLSISILLSNDAMYFGRLLPLIAAFFDCSQGHLITALWTITKVRYIMSPLILYELDPSVVCPALRHIVGIDRFCISPALGF